MPKPVGWTSELVARFWAGVSATRLSELSFAKLNSSYLLELIGPHLQPEGRHLDFGAGEGDLLLAMVERGYRTAAYDSVARGLDKVQQAIGNNPKFLGTIKHGHSEPFDVVLMVEVLEHILDQDLPAVMENIHGLLTNDGTLIVTTPNSEDLDLASVYCPNCDTFFHRWQHMRSFTDEMLERFLKQYKFECVAMHKIDFSNNRISIEELKFLKELIGALYNQLDESAHASSFKSLEDRTREYSEELLRRNRVRESQSNKGLRIGNESHLIYVGKKSQ